MKSVWSYVDLHQICSVGFVSFVGLLVLFYFLTFVCSPIFGCHVQFTGFKNALMWNFVGNGKHSFTQIIQQDRSGWALTRRVWLYSGITTIHHVGLWCRFGLSLMFPYSILAVLRLLLFHSGESKNEVNIMDGKVIRHLHIKMTGDVFA